MILTIKPVGKTPLEVITQLKAEQDLYKNKKLAYAGRLDPMAQGLLIILEDSECLDRKKYELLDKTYIFEAVFGLESDSYDVLGIIKNNDEKVTNWPSDNVISEYIKNHDKEFYQSYPPYSSKRVAGKPLFYWARNNKIDRISIPKNKVKILDATFQGSYNLSFHDLFLNIKEKISAVNGDFRQAEILHKWESLYKADLKKIFKVASFRIDCSSGFYVRSFVHEMGVFLRCGALTLSINRTRVGPYFSKTGSVSGQDNPRHILP
jgi:tRNA pseudouridine55 synthase